MGKRAMSFAGEDIAAEAARIICEESIPDYRSAKLKAAQRLGLGSRAALPENARIESAVVEYQRLFGGAEYFGRLRRMRQTAIRAMRLLQDFEPRLVGAVTNGAVTAAHRVQLHVFCDAAEMLDIFLQDRGIRAAQDERGYRFPDGREQRIALARFEADGIGVDVAVFPFDGLRRAPLSPTNGMPMRRLDLQEAEKLAAMPPDIVAGD